MIELHIYVEPYEGKEKNLEAVFKKEFVPAISVQKGFEKVTLLKRRDNSREYLIVLAFETEEHRLKWVESKEHQIVWPKIVEQCTRISSSGFDIVEKSASM